MELIKVYGLLETLSQIEGLDQEGNHVIKWLDDPCRLLVLANERLDNDKKCWQF